MWERTERFVDVLQVPEDQEKIKEGVVNFVKKGKTF